VARKKPRPPTSTPPKAAEAESRSDRRQRERKERAAQPTAAKVDARPLLSAAWPHWSVKAMLLAIAIGTIAAARTAPLFSERLEQRADLRRQAEDGHEYPYLIGQDSYSWVRKAKNYLNTGTPCDVVVDDQCRDLLRHAPVGSEMPYASSLHIRALAWMHEAVTLFRPQTPIEVSAFFLQVVVGAFGAVPAFFIGMRLGGAFGGFAAAMLVGLQGDFFQRSLGADNDVWHLVLPMCALWAILAAIERTILWQRLACAAVAGVVIGLHADIWKGFGLGFLVIFLGLVAFIGWTALRLWSEQERPALKRELGVLALVLALFLGGAVTVGHEHHKEWNQVVARIGLPRLWPAPERNAAVQTGGKTRRAARLAEAPASNPELMPRFPYGLKNVGELRVIERDELTERFGGSFMLFGSVFGLLVLLLPFGAWSAAEVGLLMLGGVLVGGAVLAKGSLLAIAGCAALPALLLLGRRILSRTPLPQAPIAGALFLAAWLTATLSLSTGGQRYILLAAAPLGLSFGCGAGHLIHHVRQTTRIAAIAWALALGLVVFVAAATRPNIEYARNRLPDLNDTWWDAMTRLKEGSPDDAIVHTWWPYGYWVQYIAERGVSGDGSSALKRLNHWLGRALMTPDEREALGLLRMLSCSSDASGEPEEALSAYRTLVRAGANGYVAYDLILRMVTMSRSEAGALLSQYSYVDEQEKAQILEATHCKPRPTYLVLSDKQLRQSDLRYQGNWDPKRALIAHALRDKPEKEALGILLTQLGMKGSEAAALVKKATAITTEAQRDHFVAPAWPPFLPTQCRDQGEQRRCKIAGREGQNVMFDSFTYPLAAPERGTFTVAGDRGAKSVVPDTVVVATSDGMQTHRTLNTSARDYSVLVDSTSRNVFVASSALVRSVFVRLMLLPSLRMRGFQRFDERRGSGERVVTYRIRFPESG
jgi:asparagine N-glycosylation enzyme membrane subunit Stt3